MTLPTLAKPGKGERRYREYKHLKRAMLEAAALGYEPRREHVTRFRKLFHRFNPTTNH